LPSGNKKTTPLQALRWKPLQWGFSNCLFERFHLLYDFKAARLSGGFDNEAR